MLNIVFGRHFRTSVKAVRFATVSSGKESTEKKRKSKKKIVTTEDVKSSTCEIHETTPQKSADKPQESYLDFPIIYSVKHDSGISIEKFAEKTICWTESDSASVSKVLSDTMSAQARVNLARWKKRKIKELGLEGFYKYQAFLLSRGHSLHSNLRDYLSGETALDDLNIKPENEGHWESLRSIFPKIKPSCLEMRISHPLLKYHGIVDCICELDDQYVLLDWKTSEKKKLEIEHLYDNPLQVAAYIGAINFNPSFVENNLKQGAVIVAYNCGSPADVFFFDPEKHWKAWLQRLGQFHTKVLKKSLP